MEHTAAESPGVSVATPVCQAYHILQFAFAAAPIIAGLDKLFLHLLTNWDMYLAPVISNVTHGARWFMPLVGAVEIIAGVIVALRPRVGAYIVTLWLLLIIINLLMIPGFYDIALRDFGLMLGALALGRLSEEFA